MRNIRRRVTLTIEDLDEQGEPLGASSRYIGISLDYETSYAAGAVIVAAEDDGRRWVGSDPDYGVAAVLDMLARRLDLKG